MEIAIERNGAPLSQARSSKTRTVSCLVNSPAEQEVLEDADFARGERRMLDQSDHHYAAE